MSQRLFGVETEYGLSIIPVAGATGDTDRATREFVELARKYPHLPGHRSSGIFLGNGGRFYIDCGAHPEMATPECANPWDACRYVLAGEQMLQSIAEEFTRRDRRTAQTLLSKGNVDYGTHATWGCHESYMHHGVDQNTLSRHVIPHLVSRVVVCGAGGFDSHSPGLDFLISPRVAHLQTVVSGESTSARGIFHTRDEPLCGKGFRRMHVLCGESLCGEAGTWLKVGTTALVVALIEAGDRKSVV